MENISVSVRLRPLNGRELKMKQSERWRAMSKFSSIVQTDASGTPLKQEGTTFSYDNVFDKKASTTQIFDKVGRAIVSGTLDGVNGTIFAYGQTSSGKTYTMLGDKGAPGILGQAAEQIFQRVEAQRGEREFLVRVSYIEIYNENVRDLLDPKAGIIKVREDRVKGVYVASKEMVVNGMKDIQQAVDIGSQNRHVGVTQMNAHSSRSHTIFRVGFSPLWGRFFYFSFSRICSPTNRSSSRARPRLLKLRPRTRVRPKPRPVPRMARLPAPAAAQRPQQAVPTAPCSSRRSTSSTSPGLRTPSRRVPRAGVSRRVETSTAHCLRCRASFRPWPTPDRLVRISPRLVSGVDWFRFVSFRFIFFRLCTLSSLSLAQHLDS